MDEHHCRHRAVAEQSGSAASGAAARAHRLAGQPSNFCREALSTRIKRRISRQAAQRRSFWARSLLGGRQPPWRTTICSGRCWTLR